MVIYVEAYVPKAILSAQFYCTTTKTENLITVPAGFHGDKTPLSFEETPPHLSP